MSALTLKIVSPDGVDQSYACDSVTLWMAPDCKGRGEGSIGIHHGHADAVIGLGKGPITALQNGKTVYSGQAEGGFVTVLQNVVTVVSPHVTSN